jgi:hypothetical protein
MNSPSTSTILHAIKGTAAGRQRCQNEYQNQPKDYTINRDTMSIGFMFSHETLMQGRYFSYGGKIAQNLLGTAARMQKFF